ncbi:MAG TPA: glycoside hydrolase family 15 protein [Vicinamibacterales bacterium]|nr:glycoside hydrolase family 15 protein [Vicinamibacterales bacterium]
MSDPCPITLNHGVIGNGRVLALISPSTHIDWLCMPRFDSASVFGRILDIEKGGTFAFQPDATGVQTHMEYVINTNVLRTTVTCPEGRFDVYDYAPRIPAGLDVEAPIEIHRLIVPREGAARVRVQFDPKPGYAVDQHPKVVPMSGGLQIGDGACAIYLRTNAPLPYLESGQPIRIDEPFYFAVSYGRPSDTDSVESATRVRDLTIAGWRAWAKSCALPRFASLSVLRSALCLKLHAYSETGAIIAAATTSIPEAVGSERTWDYRYCWLRDAAFVVEALRRVGHLAEGEAFVSFLRDVAEAGPLQPLYGIGGERELTEEHLDHLDGYCGSKPVRIGNAAYFQRQHDLMGEMILCLDTITADPRVVIDETEPILRMVERFVGEAMVAVETDDTGLWEYRTFPNKYTFSHVLCWVAASRGATLVRRLGRDDLAGPWETWADGYREEILRRAYNPEVGYFTQVLDGKFPDASNLLLPTLGLIDPRDPRFISTVEAYERLLVEDGLMLRYRHKDDFGDTTSAFSICSFWWAEALAMVGRLEDACKLFDRLMTHANCVGLFSEDIEPRTGVLLGNFPQAYTHVGLINTAVTISELLEARDARFRAWS